MAVQGDLPVERTDDEWRAILTPEQYTVLRQQGTEAPFTGAYWDDHAPGMYHCAGCGTPLFSSDDKFDSGTGWPSFTRPVEDDNVGAREDSSHGMRRIEVVCIRYDLDRCHGDLRRQGDVSSWMRHVDRRLFGKFVLELGELLLNLGGARRDDPCDFLRGWVAHHERHAEQGDHMHEHADRPRRSLLHRRGGQGGRVVIMATVGGLRGAGLNGRWGRGGLPGRDRLGRRRRRHGFGIDLTRHGDVPQASPRGRSAPGAKAP